MLALTNVARNFSTNSKKIREVCEILKIEIRQIGQRFFIDSEDSELILHHLRQNKEELLTKEELEERIRIAKRYKKSICGDDIEMSYARFSEISDIYVYFNGDIWICQGCKLKKRHDYEFKTLTTLRNHINSHIEAGHNVPYFTTERIDFEIQNRQDIWGYPIEKELI